MAQFGAIVILAVTVGLSLSRPSLGRLRVQPAAAALLGAALTVGSGLLSPREAVEVLEFLTMPVLTIVSLMIITIIVSHTGFFRLLAWKLAVRGGGDARKLFAYLFFAGTITGTLFTNDAAVLIFTPMVYGLLEEIRRPSWTPANAVPFYFAVLYVANLAGALVISNPINIIMTGWFEIGFVEYALWMMGPAIVSMVVTYVGLRIFFRNDLPLRYNIPQAVAHDPTQRTFRWLSGGVLCVTLVGFFTETLTGIPTGFVAAGGALLLMGVYWAFAGRPVAGVILEVGWDAVIFVIGIFMVANGLRTTGLTDTVGSLLMTAASTGEGFGNYAAGFVAGVSSAVMNNHPTASTMALAIGDLPLPELSAKIMALSALIGGDLGPKMLPIGSLAALLWFRILRSKGVEISYRQYIRLGVPVTLAAILLSVAMLNFEYWLFQRFG